MEVQQPPPIETDLNETQNNNVNNTTMFHSMMMDTSQLNLTNNSVDISQEVSFE